MSSPEVHRPVLPRRTDTARRRRVSQKEKRRQNFIYWVTVALATVFIISSVGLVVMIHPSRVQQKTTPAQEAQERLAADRTKALKNPKNPEWPYDMARSYINLGQLNQAITQYRAALEIDPGYIPALQELSELYLMAQDQPQQAQQLLKTGIAAETRDIARLNAKHKASGASGEPDIQPNVKLRTLLFEADMQLGKAYESDAQAAAQQALTINPSSFASGLEMWALQMVSKKQKEVAFTGLQIALRETRALKDTQTEDKLKQVMGVIVKFMMQEQQAAAHAQASGAPAPQTNASGAPAPQANASSAPAPQTNASSAPAPQTNASAAPAPPQ